MSASAPGVSVPEPLIDALSALDYLASIAWDEITDETKNVVSTALHDAMEVAYGREPGDDEAADVWDDAWRAGMEARATRLVAVERARLAALRRR